jgi:hypothetical protein
VCHVPIERLDRAGVDWACGLDQMAEANALTSSSSGTEGGVRSRVWGRDGPDEIWMRTRLLGLENVSAGSGDLGEWRASCAPKRSQILTGRARGLLIHRGYKVATRQSRIEKG